MTNLTRMQKNWSAMVGKIHLLSGSAKQLLTVVLAIFAISSTGLAQTFPTNCSSKELELIETSLRGSTENSLAPGNRKFSMTITNKGTTDKRSYVLWAKMNRYDINGVLKETRNVAFGVDSVRKNSTMTLTAKDSLYFGDGDMIELTNVYTAWSSKNTDDITYLMNNTTKIAPNCAVRNPIKVYTGVNARFFTEKAACANGKGLIKTRPFGGRAPYTVSVSLTGSTSQTTTTLTNDLDSMISSLPPGIYKVTVVDGKYNSSIFTREVLPPDGIGKPNFSVTHPSCTNDKGNVKLNTYNNGHKYVMTQDGVVKYTFPNENLTEVISGDYRLEAQNGICKNSDSVKVNRKPFKPSEPKFTVNHPTCTRPKGIITITEFENGATYYMNLNGSEVNATNGEFSEIDPGTYTIGAKGNVCKTEKGTQVNEAPPKPHDIQATLTQSNTSNCLRGGKIEITTWNEDKGNNYTYILVNSADTIYAEEGFFNSVKQGTYDLYAIRGVCFKTQGVSIDAPAPRLADIEEGDIEFVQPSFCSDGSIKIKNGKYSGHKVVYSLFDGAWQDANDFNGVRSNIKNNFNPQVVEAVVEGGQRTVCPGEWKGSLPCAPIAPLSSEVASTSNKTATEVASVKKENTYLGSANLDAAIDVKTIPNPFFNKVRFVISSEDAGFGTLDIYNMQGQKVKTVYQGYINKGTNFFDLTMPSISRNAQLVYELRVGGTRLSGKLLQTAK